MTNFELLISVLTAAPATLWWLALILSLLTMLGLALILKPVWEQLDQLPIKLIAPWKLFIGLGGSLGLIIALGLIISSFI